MKHSRNDRVYILIILGLITLAIFQLFTRFHSRQIDNFEYPTTQSAEQNIEPSDTPMPTDTPVPQLQKVLYASGEIHTDGTVKINPFFQDTELVSPNQNFINTNSTLPFSIEVKATNEATIVRSYFDQQLVQVPKTEYTVNFNQVLPITDEIGKIQIKKGESILYSAIPSRNSPEVTLTAIKIYPHKTLQISWTGTDKDNDTLFYEVQYSANNGQTWQKKALNITSTSIDLNIENNLQATSGAKIKILVSDGINTNTTTSASFALE